MKDTTLTRILGFFIAIFAVVIVVAVAAVANINRAQASRDWVNATYATISAFENILAGVRAGDADTRTYALSGDARDLAAAREAFAGMDEYLQLAHALTRNPPTVQAAVNEVAGLAQQRLSFAESVWSARRTGGRDAAMQLLAHDADSGAIGTIKRQLEKLRDEQFALLRDREQLAYRQAQTTRWIVGAGVVTNLVLFLAVIWLIRDDLRARRRAAQVLEEANAQLEAKVQARTAELTEANRRLTAENFERKWAAQSQEHQLRYNQTIVNVVNDLVFVLTKTLAITRINPAVMRALGRDETSVLSQPLTQIIDAPETEFAGMLRALNDGRELHDIRATIGGRLAQMNLFPLRDRDKVIGGIAIARFDHPTHASV